MLDRCNNPNSKDYDQNGAKGIKVEWDNFESFLNDMGERPKDSYLRRKDPFKNFNKENCEWFKKIHTRQDDLYTIWRGVKRRSGKSGPFKGGCYTKNGIDMCDRWLDFNNFKEDMGKRPSKNHSIERIDNKKGYFPDNCKWALPKEQANNTSNNHFVEVFGKRQTVSQWCDELDISPSTFQARLKALVRPAEPRKQKVKQLHPETRETIKVHNSAKEASKQTGIGRAAIQKCLSGANKTSGGYAWEYD